MPTLHLVALGLLLGLFSALAWSAGILSDTPINASLTAQMDIYPYWRDTLQPRYGFFALPLAAGLVALEMLIITAIYTPLLFLLFRYLGGAKEPRGLLRAFQGFVYGLTPVLFGGFLPYLGLAVGIYATVLQLYRGPSITLKNRSVFSYLPMVLVLTYAILRYWQGGLL